MPASPKYKALVVDDGDDQRRLITRVLSAEGIECHEACDGVVAGNLMRVHRFDLVTLDLVMPRIHGHKLAVEILAMPNPPIVVIVTGATEARIARDLLLRGVADVIYKPLRLELFSAKMVTLLERANSRNTAPELPQPAPATSREAQRGDIVQATESLRSEFARVTASFERTIQHLESKKNDLQSDFITSVQVFINLMDSQGQAGTSHAGRVEETCRWMANQMGLTADEKHELQVAAVLHEIGQFGMPDFVRQKSPWDLSPDERDVYEKYPIMGATLMSEIKGAERIAETIELHAENYAGNGFPFKRAGLDIPLHARIVRLADGLDTFEMHETNGCANVDLVSYLTRKRGTVFDPELVPLGIRYIDAKAERVAMESENGVMVAANCLPEGAILLNNIHDRDGRFLARAGAQVNSSLANRLAHLLGDDDICIMVKTA